jgi:hypothetical protein
VAIVFKDLHKLVSNSKQENKGKELFKRLQDKPFWIWDKQQHKQENIRTDGDCCMNHIISFNFNSEHKAMLGHCKMIMENDGGRIAINPDKFDKLITALRTAVDNDGTLDKESTSYNDIFDAFRLALKFYHFEDNNS